MDAYAPPSLANTRSLRGSKHIIRVQSISSSCGCVDSQSARHHHPCRAMLAARRGRRASAVVTAGSIGQPRAGLGIGCSNCPAITKTDRTGFSGRRCSAPSHRKGMPPGLRQGQALLGRHVQDNRDDRAASRTLQIAALAVQRHIALRNLSHSQQGGRRQGWPQPPCKTLRRTQLALKTADELLADAIQRLTVEDLALMDTDPASTKR